MCGILGGNQKIWNYSGAIEEIKHRGPNSQKIISEEDFILGFVRLAIIDLDPRSDQPMISTNKDIQLLFNGEIYNYKEVRKILEENNYVFRTESDTEVVLNAYQFWGKQFISKMDGMYGIAIYDKRSQEIILFRDIAGIKPLYYFYDGLNFAFCSELKGLIKLCNNIRFEIDKSAIYDYLTYLYIPAPKSMYLNVFKLLPAHHLTFNLKNKKIHTDQYWQLNPKPNYLGTIEDAAKETRKLIEEAVSMQMVADVPVGFFLSGGIDSSTVVAAAKRVKNDLRTFSIGFNDIKSELKDAQIIAEHFNTHHTAKMFEIEKIEELIPKLKQWYDEPYADTSAFPSYFVSEIARKDVTVVLTGDGGDEIFGGYRWYYLFRSLQKKRWFISSFIEMILSRLKRFFKNHFLHAFFNILKQKVSEDFSIYTNLLGGLTKLEKEKYRKILAIPKDYDDYWYFRKYWDEKLPLLTRLQYLDFHTYLPDDILTKVDRVTMSVSIEARVPLLSKNLIEFFFSLPEYIRYYNKELKGLIKYSLKGVLPVETLNKKKQGFSIPSKYLYIKSEERVEYLLKRLYPEILSK